MEMLGKTANSMEASTKKNHIKETIIIGHFENKAEIRRNMETQWFQGCYTLYKQPRVDESATQTDQLSYHVLSSILFTARCVFSLVTRCNALH